MQPLSIRQLFVLLLGLTYIGLGVFMYVKKVIPVSPWMEILSLMFVIYGIWRISRAFIQK